MDTNTLFAIAIVAVAAIVVAFMLIDGLRTRPDTPSSADEYPLLVGRLIDLLHEESKARSADTERLIEAMTEQLRVTIAMPEPAAPVATERAWDDDLPELPDLDGAYDPTDSFIHDRPGAGRVIGRDELEPFGIPGLVAPPMALDEEPRLPPNAMPVPPAWANAHWSPDDAAW